MASDYHNQKFKEYIHALRKNQIIQVYAKDVAEIKERCKTECIAIEINYTRDSVIIRRK